MVGRRPKSGSYTAIRCRSSKRLRAGGHCHNGARRPPPWAEGAQWFSSSSSLGDGTMVPAMKGVRGYMEAAREMVRRLDGGPAR
ncbi:hypothetical protein GUJ93_ZPchr0013g36434 [Zizania palustris]|uniref:Uncharacterized protein n=1 Tax=Zizania palustris TaxID=103762 RepID=A0A8J5WY85_ZIZPA|nr:hypothetical protein GUJ93_ZPchr0013g36434 [Zizania palustris]KAG8097532.1 hypothetical protein GUJ93_ZPchr0013g36434 [Zizania palustris]